MREDPIVEPQGAVLDFNWPERLCRLAAAIAILVMLVVVGVDIVSRAIFDFSFEMSDELGGYLLAAIAFFSMSVCQASGSFHHVEFIRGRLAPRTRLKLDIFFDLLSLGAALTLGWQFVGLEAESLATGDRAPTYLAIPYWLPQLSLLFGIAAFTLTLLRTLIFHLRQLESERS